MPTQSRRTPFVFLGILLTHSLAALSAKPNLSGTWTVTVDMPSRGTRSTTLTLEQVGEKLSGHIVGVRGDEAITGSVVGTQIQFSYSTNSIRTRTESGDKPLTLNYSGVTGDNDFEVKAPSPLGETVIKAKRKQLEAP